MKKTPLIGLLTALSFITSAAFAQVPSPIEVQKVVNYFYSGAKSPILVEIKICDNIIAEGDEKNNCENELDANSIVSGTEASIWMNYLVPKDASANILLQLNQKGITRATRTATVSSSFRYRTWKKVKFNKAGDWTIKVFHESDDDVQELYSSTVNVKEAPAEPEAPTGAATAE